MHRGLWLFGINGRCAVTAKAGQKPLAFIFVVLLCMINTQLLRSQTMALIETKAPTPSEAHSLFLKTNVLPWGVAIPNIGGEIKFFQKWSASLDLMYCPWKISDRFSIKTVAILPEVKWWPKGNERGHSFNIHVTVGWYNARFSDRRYQDSGRPLLGAGIGYAYLLRLNEKWGMEFSLGLGFLNTRYDRFHNIKNGAKIDTRTSTYWGLDRVGVTLVYHIGDL